MSDIVEGYKCRETAQRVAEYLAFRYNASFFAVPVNTRRGLEYYVRRGV